MIWSAVLVQIKGLGSRCCGDVLLDDLDEHGDTCEAARRMRFVVISRNQRSTRLSHEELVGVKWKWNRLCLANHARTSGWLWVRSCPR